MPAEHALDAILGGAPSFSWRGESFEIESRKPLAMLCFLCLQHGASERERLAELFWGPERLLNVRQALYQLRQLPGAETWLRVDEEVAVCADSDVARFEEALRREAYAEALEQWQPPLLAGLTVPRAPAFREWLELERSRLEGLYLTSLESRAAELEREGSFALALASVERFLALDPLRESAYRSAMRLRYLLGDPEAAIDQYRTCRKVLRDEFDSEPLPATEALAETIARSEPLSIAVSPGHLPANLLRLLQAVVVGRGELGTAELASILETDEFEVADALVELERRRLLEGPARAPEAAAEETLARMAEPLKRLLHSRAAAAMARQAPDDREEAIGEHLLAADEAEAAAAWLLRALRRAVDRNHDEETERLAYRTAWCGDTRQRFEAIMLLEHSYERTGDAEGQDRALELAGELAWELQEDPALARIDLRRARRLLRLDSPDEALSAARGALAVARRLGNATLLAQALNALGVVHFYAGRLDEAFAAFEENAGSEAPAERYRALNNLGAIAGIRGDPSSSYEYLEEALTLARGQGKIDDVGACLNNLAATAERMADYGRAAKRLREGRDLARRTGSWRHAAQALVNLAEVHCRRGALGTAWNTAEEALLEGGQLDDPRIEGQALEQFGEIARLAGDPDEAARRFEAAVESFAHSGDERKLAAVRCNLAVARFLAGKAPADTVVAALGHLDGLGLGETCRWFWAELALAAPTAGLSHEWLCRALDGAENQHLSLVAEIARLRARLLERAGPLPPPAALTALLARLEVAESPMGHLHLALAIGPDSDGGRAELRRAEELLAEQQRGLPRRLRRSLERQPQLWRSSLGF